jgi:hypothetical protein
LLLPCDFDSAKTRASYFGDSPHFVGKIVLRQRIVWFKRDDGERENPKENSAWFLWGRSLLRIHRPPIILYAPARGVAAMIDMALAVIIVAAPLLALAVDLAALAGWLRMRWRSPPMGRPHVGNGFTRTAPSRAAVTCLAAASAASCVP